MEGIDVDFRSLFYDILFKFLNFLQFTCNSTNH